LAYKTRKDLRLLNRLFLSLFGEKIDSSKAKSKIFHFLDNIKTPPCDDVELIVAQYIDHLNSNTFTPLGRRMHLFMCYISLAQGSGFIKKYKQLDSDFYDPLFVVGLPRSGTTNLHNLFIEELGYNGLKYWQLASPSSKVRYYKLDNLLRRTQTNLIFSIFKYLVPSIQEMHHVNMDTYEECWHFHKNIFLCYNYVIQTDFQKLEDYLMKHDSTFILTEYKKFLSSNKEFLSKRFALKCPEYLLFLNDIKKVFPQSRIVWIHRDPIDSILSYCPMIDNTWEFFRGKTDKVEVGRYIISFYKKMLSKAMIDRKSIGGEIYDVSYKNLLSNREDLILNLKDNFQCYERDNIQKNENFYINKHQFESEMYKINKDEIRNDFSFYYDEYGEYL